jgi:DUF438 domain-containing protein
MSEHWADLLMKDHETTERVLDAVAKAWDATNGPPTGLVRDTVDYLSSYADNCHNRKEEKHLFPLIEARGIPSDGGPLAVMLAEHEQSRGLLAKLKALGGAFVGGDGSALADLRRVFEEYSALLKNHYWKENDILYPMAKRVMTPEDDKTVVSGIAQLEMSLGPDTRMKYYALADQIISTGKLDDLSVALERNVLGFILNTLPIELSFVDATDTVRYFSHENGKKIFPRTRGVIGSTVQNCHPQKSVHKVNQILADFKAGKRDVAEFWIDMGGRKIHIRYFPVRDHGGTYLGCLETVQDVTEIQKLSGQQRLLDVS